MKKVFVVCLVAAMFVAPLVAGAEETVSPKAAVQLQGAETSLRDDIVAMRKEMERMSDAASDLAVKLEGTPQKDAAMKLQEHVTSLIQRTYAIEKKMDAESGGVMASFKEEADKDANGKAK